jgi:hypothetical protein
MSHRVMDKATGVFSIILRLTLHKSEQRRVDKQAHSADLGERREQRIEVGGLK